MKKQAGILTIMFLFLIILSTAAQAVSADLWWMDYSEEERDYNVGDQIDFRFWGSSENDNVVRTRVFVSEVSTSMPEYTQLFDETALGGSGDVFNFDSSSYEAGSYLFYILAEDLTSTNNQDADDYLYFNLEGEGEENFPPVFTNLQDYFSRDLNLVNVDLVNLSEYTYDGNEDDVLTFDVISQSDTSVAQCTIQDESMLNCQLLSVGDTDLVVQVSDGQAVGQATITLEVYDSTPSNEAPFFEPLPVIELDGPCDEQFIIDIDEYVIDPEGDSLNFAFSTQYTNFSVINNCNLDDSVLTCDASNSGETIITLIAADNYHPAVAANLTVIVGDESCENNAPEFTQEVYNFTYNINEGSVDVVDLASISDDIDPEDVLTYNILSQSHPMFADCDVEGASVVHCDLIAVGTTHVVVEVFDGDLSDQATLIITVVEDDPTNHPPAWGDLPTINIDGPCGTHVLINLEPYATDFDNDDLDFSINTQSTNVNILENCELVNDTLVVCDAIGSGFTFMQVGVTDAVNPEVFTYLMVNVGDESCNSAPVFTDLELFYSYNLSEENVDVVDLAYHVFDGDGDDLTFFLDDSQTNSAVVECVLVEPNGKSSSGSDKGTGPGGMTTGVESVLNCDLTGAGTTTIDVFVTDTIDQAQATITIEVNDSSNENNAPEFTEEVYTYTYNIVLDEVNVVDLALISDDIDPNDVLSYSIVAQSNTGIASCVINGISMLHCDLASVGQTQLLVEVSDGDLFDQAVFVINVVENSTENTAPYFEDLQLYYSYPLNLSAVEVVDLSQFAHDDEFDTVIFGIDTTNTDVDVVTCSLQEASSQGVPPTPFLGFSALYCELNGVGNTTVEVSVTDGEFTTWVTVAIEVYEEQGNLPPYFENISYFYSYNINLGDVDVVDLAQYAFDPDDDDLTFSINTDNTNESIIDCSLEDDSVLHCDLIDTGLTTVRVEVTDGYYITWVTLTIHVFEQTGENTAPYFDPYMQVYYSYNLAESQVVVSDLSVFAYDNEFDTVSFSIETSGTNSSVVSCVLEESSSVLPTPTPFQGPSVLVCDLNSVGTTSLQATVFDGELSSTVNITINVFSDSNNTAPFFAGNMNLFYSYDLGVVNEVDVLHLAAYGFDNEFDTVTFGLDQSATDSAVVACTLEDGPSVSSPTPYIDPSVLHCMLNGVGITTLDVIISDGEFSSTATITVQVTESQSILPVAVISSPGTSGFADEVSRIDGSQSYSPIGLDIVQYEWTIIDAYGNTEYTTNGVSAFSYVFGEGSYTIELTVTDSLGGQDSTTKLYKVYTNPSADDDPEEGLKVVTYDVYGFDFERAYLGGDLVVSAWVENQAGEDLDGVRMTYTLPEFGLRFTSQAHTIEDGERKHMVVHVYVPTDIDPGVYYPYISFSDGDIRRVKAGYLEVYE